MTLVFSEDDMMAVGKIQELKNTTVERAKEMYRQGVTKLADPTLPNRHEVVLENIQRTNGKEPVVSYEKSKRPERMTRNEKRLVHNKKLAEKEAAKKAAKSAKPKTKTERKPRAPKEEPAPRTELKREVKLVQLGDSPFYEFMFTSGNAAGALLRRDRTADQRFAPLNISDTNLEKLKTAAGSRQMFLCVQIVVNERYDQGYAVPVSLLRHKPDGYNQLDLDNSTRQKIAAKGWDDCKFVA